MTGKLLAVLTLASTVLLFGCLTYVAVRLPSAFLAILVLVMGTQAAVLLLTALAVGKRSQLLTLLKGLIACWCVCSSVVIVSGSLSAYQNHGFLGWERDGYWETETSIRYGVTVWDLLTSAWIVSTQSISAWLLLHSPGKRDAAQGATPCDDAPAS